MAKIKKTGKNTPLAIKLFISAGGVFLLAVAITYWVSALGIAIGLLGALVILYPWWINNT
ncbi:MAG: hypothetical protein ABIB71_08360 [Candidatus Woesearchaeota archaeon]